MEKISGALGGRRLPENARILIVKTHAIGDLLMTTPAIRDLRKAYPLAHLALLVGSWSAPAIRKNPALDEIIEFDDGILLNRRVFGIIRLLLQLRKKRFDCALIFHPSPFLHLFALLAGIPIRYGLARGDSSRFLTAGVTEDLSEGLYYPVNFQKVAALAGVKPGSAELEVHADAGDEREVRRLLAGFGVESGFLLVAPGGGRNSKDNVEAKRWPKERFAELLEKLQRDGQDLKMVLCGSAGDKEETDFLAERFPGIIDLTARITLPQLFVLARLAKAIVCNDSAILHVGIANHTPVFTPFGPTLLTRFVPEWNRPYCIQSATACSPCYVGGHFPGCGIGFRCMTEIGVAEAHSRIEAALSRAVSPAFPTGHVESPERPV